MLIKLLISLLLLTELAIATIDEPYHETAFIGPPNTFYGLSYFSSYKTNHFWNQRGKKLPSFNYFTRQSFRIDMEYDINDRHAIFLQGGYTQVEEQLNGNSRGLEDPEASYQYLFYADAYSAFSGKATLIIPIGPLKSCVRYGKIGGELKLLYSNVFLSQWWYDLSLGYRAYTGFPSDQIRSNLSAGYWMKPCFWIVSTTRFDYGLFNGNSKANLNNICFHPNYRLLSTQLEGFLEVYHHFTITLGGYVHLWGENIGSGGGFYSGLWIIF